MTQGYTGARTGAQSADTFRGNESEARKAMKAHRIKSKVCKCPEPWVERTDDGPHCCRCGVDL